MAFTTAEVNAWFQTIDGLPPTTPSIPSNLATAYTDQLNAGTATPVVIQANLENFPFNSFPPPTNIASDIFFRTSVAQFVLREFQAAWGAVPTTGASSQFDSWVARLVVDPSLQLGAMSQALAGTPEFMTEYGVTSATQPASIGFINLLAANLHVAVGPGAMANVGLPVWQVLQNFVTSPVVIASLETPIANFQNQLLAGTNIPGSIFTQPGLPSETFTLTVGQDTISANGEIVVNGPLGGVFGNQATLTNGDSITNAGAGSANSVLNATFHGDHGAFGVNIDAIPTWNFQQVADGTITINGGVLGSTNTITGLSTLRFNVNGFESSLNIGTALQPILPATGGTFDGFKLVIANAAASSESGVETDLAMAASGFSAAGQTINVTVAAVANTGLDFDSTYGIGAGSPTAGFTTWNITSDLASGDGTNNLRIGADGNSSATTLNLTDDGSGTILWAAGSGVSGSSAANWANLATINAGTTGSVTITGGESGSEGLLSENTTALTSLTGGTGANLFDLSASAWSVAEAAGVSINAGTNAGNVVELNIDLINELSTVAGAAFATWTGVPTLDVVADLTTNELGGPINVANFPGTTTMVLVDNASESSPVQSSAIDVTNAPNNFTLNFQDTEQGGNDFSIIGIGGLGDSATIEYSSVNESTGQFVSQGIDNVVINIGPDGGGPNFYGNGTPGHTGIEVVANDDGAAVLTINTDTNIEIGELAAPIVGTSSLTLLGGTLIAPTNGTLDISGVGSVTMGVTNASVIDDTSTGGALFMFAPGNDIVNPAYSGITVTADSGSSVLSGAVGTETLIAPALVGGTPTTAFTAIVGNDTLTDTAGGTKFWGDGGADTIAMGHTETVAANTTFFGYILAGPGTFQNQLITDNTDAAYQGFWGLPNGSVPTPIGASTSASNTTITGFSLADGDNLSFNVAAWAGGHAGTGSLVEGDGHTVVPSGPPIGITSTMQIADVPFALIGAGTNVVLDDVPAGGFADGASLAASLHSAAGAVTFSGTGVHAHTAVHMLFAYQTDTPGTIEVADVDLVNTSGVNEIFSNTLNAIHVSDMVKLVGVGSLNDLEAHPGAIHLAQLA
jgi:hypothetical protein